MKTENVQQRLNENHGIRLWSNDDNPPPAPIMGPHNRVGGGGGDNGGDGGGGDGGGGDNGSDGGSNGGDNGSDGRSDDNAGGGGDNLLHTQCTYVCYYYVYTLLFEPK